MTLQPSEYDIQREVEALRDIRRRSITPGALTIDPDLPNQSPPSSPTYRLGAQSPGLSFNTVPTANSQSEISSTEGSSSRANSNASNSASTPTDDPFHLFWVPASLHPEIAPAEFRAFLKQHARSPSFSEDGHDSLKSSSSFSSSSSSSGLSRKRSMLSRQYRPNENDEAENEEVVFIRRNRSGLHTNRVPQLTISDLQKLEELAEQASQSEDPSRLRNVLRRSLSLNLSPSAIDKMDITEMGDEADAPIIVPPPGQILRRAARTKIRKPGLPGDGGGHRFGQARRAHPTRSSTTPVDSHTSSDRSSSDHGDSVESVPPDQRRTTFSGDGSHWSDTFSEEAQIFDAYARDEDDETSSPAIITSPPTPLVELSDVSLLPYPPSEIPSPLFEALGPIIQQPQPQQLATPPLPVTQAPSRTPSPPTESPPPSTDHLTPLQAPPPSFLSSPPSQPLRKDKDRKGLFGKWGSDKASKKSPKDKDRENRERAEKEKEKEKDSSFFGSLFGGGSKKKQDEGIPVLSSASGREAAQALLGASKSKILTSPVSPAFSSGIGLNPHARYPIHVERAIYRLSHIKLANPRRPLYEQVLISNLMFWYLGVINKAQSTPPSPSGQDGVIPTPAPTPGMPTENDDAEKERREREQRERLEAERLERERLEREQREREVEMKKRESGRRGSLTKTPSYGSPGGGRRAEMPVKGPQYEMQHRVMEQEYGGYNGQSHGGAQMGRSMSVPVGNGASQYSRSPQQPVSSQFGTPPTKVQSQLGEHFHYSQDSGRNQSRPPDQPLRPQSPIRPRQHSSSPPSTPMPRQPRSPQPTQNDGQSTAKGVQYANLNNSQDNVGADEGHERVPGRSLSANAIPSPSPQMNGRARKGHNAHTAMASPGEPLLAVEGKDVNGADEDMPLAMWQQQQRR